VFQAKAIEAAVATILESIGEDPQRPGLRETPKRVARMYQELFSGLDQDPKAVLATGFEEGHDEPVVLRDIPFYSVCEHHLLPFFGVAHLGYIPKGWVVGASKLVRALETVARRPQLQERLTRQLADALYEGLAPRGVAVMLSAEHLCMSMRGVQRPGTRVLTTATRGVFPEGGISREQFLALVQGS
jgi:GTP cyclohydrolase I